MSAVVQRADRTRVRSGAPRHGCVLRSAGASGTRPARWPRLPPAPGPSRRNSRGTVILRRHGEWAVDVVSCRDHREVRQGVCEGAEGGQRSDSGSGGGGHWLVAGHCSAAVDCGGPAAAGAPRLRRSHPTCRPGAAAGGAPPGPPALPALAARKDCGAMGGQPVAGSGRQARARPTPLPIPTFPPHSLRAGSVPTADPR